MLDQVKHDLSKSATLFATYNKMIARRSPTRVNLPALARRDVGFMRCWKADPGYTLISSDFSSLEPSITAHFSQDRYYRHATYDGIGKKPYYDADGVLCIDDIYLMTASVMPGLNKTIYQYFSQDEFCEQWLKDPDVCKSTPDIKKARNRAKPACLGFNYGMGPKKFQSQCYDQGIELTIPEAQEMYKAYWSLFSGIKQMVDKITEYLTVKQFMINPFGYRLTTEPRKGYNAFIQSSASGVVDMTAHKFFARVPYAKFIAFIHDEIIYTVPDNKVDEVKRIQGEVVAEVNAELNWSIPMRLAFTPGKTFADFK